jgi:hypothetical protein
MPTWPRLSLRSLRRQRKGCLLDFCLIGPVRGFEESRLRPEEKGPPEGAPGHKIMKQLRKRLHAGAAPARGGLENPGARNDGPAGRFDLREARAGDRPSRRAASQPHDSEVGGRVEVSGQVVERRRPPSRPAACRCSAARSTAAAAPPKRQEPQAAAVSV